MHWKAVPFSNKTDRPGKDQGRDKKQAEGGRGDKMVTGSRLLEYRTGLEQHSQPEPERGQRAVTRT